MRIYFEDTDAGGIVYHASWLRFFERARTDWLRSLGLSQSRLDRENGIGFVVRRMLIDYQRPARLDDEVLIDLRVVELRRASLSLAQSARLLPDGPELVTANVQVAAIHTATGKPSPLPATLFAQLAPLKSGANPIQSCDAAN